MFFFVILFSDALMFVTIWFYFSQLQLIQYIDGKLFYDPQINKIIIGYSHLQVREYFTLLLGFNKRRKNNNGATLRIKVALTHKVITRFYSEEKCLMHFERAFVTSVLGMCSNKRLLEQRQREKSLGRFYGL